MRDQKLSRSNKTTPRSFYIISFVSILNIFAFFWFLHYCKTYNLFCHLTLWGYYLNTLYLVLNLICDVNFYIKKDTSLESFSLTVRGKFGAIANTFTYLIFILFWGILFTGLIIKVDTLGPTNNVDFLMVFKNLYLHLIISIFVFMDIFLVPHQVLSFDWSTLLYICIIYGGYIIMSLFSLYGFDIPPYPFLGMIPFRYVMLTLGSSYLLTIACYFLHLKILKLAYKCRGFCSCGEDEEEKRKKDGFQKISENDSDEVEMKEK